MGAQIVRFWVAGSLHWLASQGSPVGAPCRGIRHACLGAGKVRVALAAWLALTALCLAAGSDRCRGFPPGGDRQHRRGHRLRAWLSVLAGHAVVPARYDRGVRPPECAVCGKGLRDVPPGRRHAFGVVRFADYCPPAEEHEGGPWPGSDWFCAAHLPGARDLAASGLILSEAVGRLGARRRRSLGAQVAAAIRMRIRRQRP